VLRLVLYAALIAGLAVSPAHAAEWTVDQAASSIRFEVQASGVTVKAAFKRFEATIVFDPAKVGAASAAIDIDLASASAGDATMDAAIASREWFDAARTPRARFECRQFRKTAEGYACDGSLTIRGVAVPTVLPFTFTEDGQRATAIGTLRLDRRSWPMGASFKDEASVAYGVQVSVFVQATRKP
jgi:polyisoprenoid-binding protein YceI